ETWSRNEAVIVEIQSIRSGLDASVDASRQTLRLSDFSIEQSKARTEELFRAQCSSTFLDHGYALLRSKPIDAENCAVADLADLLEIASAKRSFVDQNDAA